MSSAAFLRAECGVRYWEDAEVNGVEDINGNLIPCRAGDSWCPTIDLASGRILDWPTGTIADIHYKVCDEGRYRLLDIGRECVRDIEGYVPKIMCPGGSGYGDYVIMKVGADGVIANWQLTLADFE